MSRAKIHDLARRDLQDIYEHIAADNRPAALRVLARFRETFQLLAGQPMMGELRNDLLMNVRQFTVGNYLVLFRPVGKSVEILQIVHSARDLLAVFRFPQE